MFLEEEIAIEILKMPQWASFNDLIHQLIHTIIRGQNASRY